MNIMGKKTGKGTQILLKLDEDPELLHEFEAIKHNMHMRNNVEVVRRLIDDRYNELQKKHHIP